MESSEILGMIQNMSRGDKTFEDKLTEHAKHIEDTVKDDYGNILTATGDYDKVKSFTTYGFSNDTLNWPLWLALYNDSWVFKRAIDKPAQDMVRTGIALRCDNVDKEKQNQVYDYLNKYRFDLIQLIQWGHLFGGSIAVMMFDNIGDEDYKKPMDYNKVKKARSMRLYVTDRWYGVAPSSSTVSDMKSIDFGKPKSYRVTFTDGKTYDFHHDYVLRYEGRVAPKLVKQGMLQGWGYAEGAHILNELSRDDQLKSAILSLVNKALIEVIKMSGVRGVFMGADKDNEQQLRKRLEMVNWGRNFNSLTFLDKEDDYDQKTFSGLSGLSELLEKNMWLISSALEMQGILFGELKGGLSQDTEALERYDEVIQNRCESYLRPVLEKFLKVIYAIVGIDESVQFSFNSLLKGKHDKDTMDGFQKFSELLSKMLGDGALTVKQYVTAIMNYAQNGVIDFGITEDDIEKLDDKVAEEMENIDLSGEQPNVQQQSV